jgi:ureidoglycolate lyase
MTIPSVRPSPANLKGFGSVVTAPAGAPTSHGADYRFWSDLAHYTIDGETEIGLCTVYRQNSPVITGMERHLRTAELLIPVDVPFVLPLLRDGEDSSAARAFRVNPGEAIVIDEGIWHGACLPVGRDEATYFVIFRRGTPHQDVEKKPVAPFEITLQD